VRDVEKPKTNKNWFFSAILTGETRCISRQIR